jgi:hypothetical protein
MVRAKTRHLNPSRNITTTLNDGKPLMNRQQAKALGPLFLHFPSQELSDITSINSIIRFYH